MKLLPTFAPAIRKERTILLKQRSVMLDLLMET